MNWSMRSATEDDLASLIEIEGKIHVAPWNRDGFASELTKSFSRFLVLTDDDTDSVIAGYIVVEVLFEEAQILNVGVDLPYRGLGFAKRMIRQAVNDAMRQGVKTVSLEVRKSNAAAIALYQSLQFAILQVRKSFYSNGEDAYQMKLSLEEDGIRF
jgi:ribosomal-protein-alanine N-acetyltransferase